jgi:hypothetical protein
MKRILLLCAFGMITACAAPQVIVQPDTTPVPDARYERVIEVPKLTKKQIFDKSKQWMALTFVSSKKAIEYEDEGAGKIIGNGIAHASSKVVVRSAMLGDMPYTTPYDVRFSLVEDMKDGKARVTVGNFQLVNQYGAGGTMHVDSWKQTEPQLAELCNGLESYLLGGDNQSW